MRALCITAFAWLLATPGAAQVIAGHTLDAVSRDAVAATVVTVLGEDGDSLLATLSDAQAAFRIELPSSGTYRLRARRIGYETVETAPILVARDETLLVEVLLGADPIDLEPLAVVGRRGGSGTVSAHRRRVERIQRTGIGYAITREDLDAHRYAYLTDYFTRVPGVRVYRAGMTSTLTVRGCQPMVFVDGVRAPGFDLNSLNPEGLEGIEVYRGATEVPVELSGVGNCGAISVVSRPGEARQGEWTLLQKIFAAGLGTAIAAVFLTHF